jgi:hypothetical protein
MADSLINLDKLSEPLTKLVEVTSAGIGTLYKPFGTVRQAKADAKAKAIAVNADLEILDIKQRAELRIEHRETLRQENIEKVVSIAANEMSDKVSNEPVDLDWSLQFFDAAQDVCDEDMQSLWARILAGEVSDPGSYSKRTLQFLKTLDKFEAEKFVVFCSFALQFENHWYVIFEDKVTKEIMEEKLGENDLFSHFASIGLISDQSLGDCESWDKNSLSYFKTVYNVTSTKEEDTGRIKSLNIPIGHRVFTQIGQQLYAMANATKIDDYPEMLSAYLNEKYNIILEIQ